MYLALASLGLFPPDVQAQTNTGSHPQPPRALLVFSEARDLPGNVLMEQSVRAEMLRHNKNVEFFAESMDAIHFSSPRHYQLFEDYIRSKYAGQKPDLVLMFLGRDYSQARAMVASAMAGVPAIFVLVNDSNAPEPPGPRSTTTIFQHFDVLGTLRFIFQLQPETRRVVVIGGTSPGDQAVIAHINATAKSVEGVAFEYWTNRPLAEIYAAAKKLPPDTVILLSSIQRDALGEAVYTAHVARTLAPAAAVPVYVMADSQIGTGALGGSVINFENLGTRAGRLGASVLAGAPPGQMPFETRSNGVPMVDSRALQRWHIVSSRLPAYTEVRYQSRSLLREHWALALFVIAGIGAQAVTIAALLVQRRRQQLAEAEILKQRAELAHVSRVSTMGQLASALTHELNQPLGAILRNAEAAEMFLQQEHPNLDEVRAILTDIRRDDKRAGNVIDRMRSLFKRQRLMSSPVDLRDLVEDTLAMARPDAEARQVKLRLEISAHLPFAQGDRIHLQQVLLNLILNGMDAMNSVPRSRRTLTVKVRRTKIGNLRVSVSDSGTGISPENARQIFEPFFTTKSNGMGMGLAITQTIIEAHGGDIWMTSSAMDGTTFTFLLPPAGSDKIKPGDLPPAL